MRIAESRNTVQRNLVMDAVHSLPHPCADEVYSYVSMQHPSVSRGTVYRNLNLLVEQGRLRRVSVPDGADHFDCTLREHYHIRCKVCGKVDDMDLPFQSQLTRHTSTGGYDIESHEILFRGICPKCKTQPSPERVEKETSTMTKTEGITR